MRAVREGTSSTRRRPLHSLRAGSAPGVAPVDDPGVVTPEQLHEALRRHPFAPRIPRAVRAVSAADGRAESWLETRGRLRFRTAGLPPYVPQEKDPSAPHRS